MLHVIRVVALISVIAGLHVVPAEARRVALIIGIGEYKIERLRNPVNDAAAVAEAFGKLGFDKVILKKNLTFDGFHAALLDVVCFGRSSSCRKRQPSSCRWL